jgi:polar amino acid transport system substrate-binding protein
LRCGTQKGSWEGLAVDLWQRVAAELRLRFEFRDLTIRELTDELQQGGLFALATATASADREPLMEFSHPYYTG